MKAGTLFSGALLAGVIIAGGTGPMIAFPEASAFTIHEGQPAPDFTLPDQEGQPIKLSSHRGQWVVLYFYPKDDTPGCTKEACSFRDNLLAIQQLNAVVLGVSVDSVESHKAFSDKNNLNFPILADDQQRVCKQYGTLTDYKGQKMARRSTVIVDPDGIVRKLFPSVEPTDHALEIRKALQDLKRS
jgi:peroxiredoxin Q/BCP